MPRLARERRLRSCVLVRTRRGDDDHAPARSRGLRRLRERRLRRHVPHVLAGLRAEGLLVRVSLAGRAFECPRRAHRRGHAARLDRDADEPAAQHRRHRRRCRCRPCGRGDRRRRQHLRDAVSAAAARARRRHRRALDDEVPRWPLRRGRWIRRDQRPHDLRAPALPAEVARRRAGAVRRLARAARA